MKRKLLFFHHCGTVGGAGISGLNFLKSIPRDEYSITIYCTSTPSDMLSVYRDNGFEAKECGADPVAFTHCVGSEKFALSPKAVINYLKVHKSKKAIERIIRSERPDVVVANSITLFWIGAIAKKYNAETICFFRETYIHGMLGVRTGYIKRQLSKNFDKIAFISNYELQRSQSIKSAKTTIYNMVRSDGYDRYSKEEARRMLGLDEDSFYVLYVGGFNALKGARVLLESIPLVGERNIKFLFVGGKPEQIANAERCKSLGRRVKGLFVKSYNKSCLELIEKKGLAERVTFFESQKDIARFYCAADALVFPMTRPHQARPIFEAGYARIPVIVTDFENIKELADESSSFLFKNRSAKALAEAITYVYEHPEEADARVQKNYVNTMRRHSPEVYEKQIHALLRS